MTQPVIRVDTPGLSGSHWSPCPCFSIPLLILRFSSRRICLFLHTASLLLLPLFRVLLWYECLLRPFSLCLHPRAGFVCLCIEGRISLSRCYPYMILLFTGTVCVRQVSIRLSSLTPSCCLSFFVSSVFLFQVGVTDLCLFNQVGTW